MYIAYIDMFLEYNMRKYSTNLLFKQFTTITFSTHTHTSLTNIGVIEMFAHNNNTGTLDDNSADNITQIGILIIGLLSNSYY